MLLLWRFEDSLSAIIQNNNYVLTVLHTAQIGYFSKFDFERLFEISIFRAAKNTLDFEQKCIFMQNSKALFFRKLGGSRG
jgi:hypothetical protein